MMGIAIIWIMLHHTQYFGLFDYGYLSYFIQADSCGVDMFLFLSGFGLVYGFKKNNTILSFYKRRVLRVLPTFIILIIVYDILTGNFIGIISPKIWFWQFYWNWYISFILLMYLIFPILYRIQLKVLYLPLILCVVLTLLLSICLIILHRDNIHDVPMLMSQRFPVFALGMLFADKRMHINLQYNSLVLFAFILCLFVVFYYRVEYLIYPIFLILTYPICFLLCKMFDLTSSYSIVTKYLNVIGKLSLELYLVHMLILPIVAKHTVFNGYWNYTMAFIVISIAAIVLQKSVNYVTSKLIK